MFKDELYKYNWQQVHDSIYSKTAADVERALSARKRTLEDFKALVSPAATPYLEQMAQISHRLTQKRYGKTMQLYIPLYLSNLCSNNCAYCGFSAKNHIKRKVLTAEEIVAEAKAIKKMGFDHLLLVTGEAEKKAGVDYLLMAFELLKPYFSFISIEVQPLEEDEYRRLHDAGLTAVYVYQETYRSETYKNYHLSGKKTDFEYRLATPERVSKGGVHKVGIGVLIGLEDWRTDSFFCAAHLDYMVRNHWKTKYSIAFPRLRPHQGEFEPNSVMTDAQLVQLICAYRLFDEDVELSLSTRESAKFRNNVMKLGITTMSAASKTEPGGYAVENHELEQFSVNDDRSAVDVKTMIEQSGYQPVWKDWDPVLQ